MLFFSFVAGLIVYHMLGPGLPNLFMYDLKQRLVEHSLNMYRIMIIIIIIIIIVV